MKLTKMISDDMILAEIGERVASRRIDFQLTQARLAEQAGVGKRTVERLENGASTQMSSVIRVFRVLDLIPQLDRMIPEIGPRPMDLLKRKGKVRKRASSSHSDETSDEPWTWDDKE
jgi:transcriptional regulator with XRE-family HTH domain